MGDSRNTLQLSISIDYTVIVRWGVRTFHDLIECTLDGKVGNDDEFELSPVVFRIEQILHPAASVSIADRSTDFVVSSEKLVRDVRSDVAIYACDEDNGSWWNGTRRRRHGVDVVRVCVDREEEAEKP